MQYFEAKAPAIKKEEWLEKIEEGNWERGCCGGVFRPSRFEISNVAFAKISDHVQPPKFL